jgi:cell wall-associated NlpC family hydrolase
MPTREDADRPAISDKAKDAIKSRAKSLVKSKLGIPSSGPNYTTRIRKKAGAPQPGASPGRGGSKSFAGLGSRDKDKKQSAIGSQVKRVGKEAAKKAVKNSARGATGGASIAVEVGIALLTTKTGRRILLAIAILNIVVTAFIFSLPVLIINGIDGSRAQVAGAITTQAVTDALQNTPGVPANLPAAVLQPFQTEGAASGVPWEILFAIAYYGRLGGVAVADQSGACPSTVPTDPYCPAVSATIVPQAKGAVGPLAYNAKALAADGISQSSVETLQGALSLAGSAIQSFMNLQNVPGSAGLLSGVQTTSSGVTWSSTTNAIAYDSAMIKALGTLPLMNQSSTLDDNIFFLAQDFDLGAVIPATSGGFGTDMVCSVGNSKAVTIDDSSGGPMTLTSTQLENAAIIVNTGKSMNVPQRGLVFGLMVALQESSLYNLPNGAIPSSFSDPNMQLGGYSRANPPENGTSLGLFQQQDNWGSVAQRMDQASSSRLFFQRLLAEPNWQNASFTTLVEEVQAPSSQYVQYYSLWQPGASTLAGAVLGIKCSSTVSTANLTGTAKTVVAAADQFVGNTPYVWGGGTSSGPSMGLNGQGAVGPTGYQGKPGFDCSGLTLYAFAQAGITLPHYSGAGGQFSIVENSPTFTTNISQLKPGDLVFFVGVGDGGSVTNPGHVGIYIGNGQMINAPTTGQLVSIAPVTQSSAGGFVGGGMP